MSRALPLPAASPPAHEHDFAVERLSSRLDSAQAFQRLAHLPRTIFFDSAIKHRRLGRYSFISGDPFDWLTVRDGRIRTSQGEVAAAEPLAALKERLRRYQMPTVAGLPPFQGGAAGLFGYGLCHRLEKIPRPRHDEFQTPDLCIGFYDWVLAFDHWKRRTWLMSTGMPEAAGSMRRRRAQQRLRDIKRRLVGSIASPADLRGPVHRRGDLAAREPVRGMAGVYSNLDRGGYLERVERIIEYLHAGDCFQVNFAQRLVTPARWPGALLFEKLRQRSPAPFSAYLDGGDFAIISASPERFLRLRHGRVETRPIKGTRPRGATEIEDAQMVADLEASVKDRAENVMIIDLLRNDLGRVCGFDSIEVPAICRVETYPHVHHLVSVVSGRLRSELDAVDLLRAAFPGGSVTGAPKIRAMEIISELEPTARGPYCGSIGYISFDGSMDMSILIRTFTLAGGWAQFPVGGGIVADSDPVSEYAETWHKATGLLRALAP